MKLKSFFLVTVLAMVAAALSVATAAQPAISIQTGVDRTAKRVAVGLPGHSVASVTEPMATQAVLLSEGFEGSVFPPAGWTHIQNNAYTWYKSDSVAHDGVYEASVEYDPAPADQDEWLISPELADVKSAELDFWSFGSLYWCRDTFDNCDLNVWIVVGPDVNDGDDIFLTRADDDWPGSYVYAESVTDLTPHLPGGPIRIGFQYSGNDGAQVALDDIMLTGITGPAGWLGGDVLDAELGGAEAVCTQATVSIDDGQDVLANLDGSYGPALILSGTHTVTATAPGFSVQTATVSIVDGLTTTQDFGLWRPVISVSPTHFLSITAYLSRELTLPLTLVNNGHLSLTFELDEQQSAPAVGATGKTQSQPGIQVEPKLLAQLAADESTGYLIYLRERPDLSPAFNLDWRERGWFVVNALRETAARSQARVRAYLDAQGAEYEAFWIANVIAVKSSNRATFEGLKNLVEIEALRAQRTIFLHEPVETHLSDVELAAVESNLTHIDVDDVWAWGVTGDGMVVANIDTGVRYTHQALVEHYRGNLGGGNFDHNYNWWDPYDHTLSPRDPDSVSPTHGSHTMGTMVGDDGGVNQIGVAPGAKWMACQGFAADGTATDVDLLECGQFILAPWDLSGSNPTPDMRPHVVNNSWGSCGNPEPYDPWYQGVVDAWVAAGVYPVFANGNLRVPPYGDCPVAPGSVGNPARYGNVTGVGALGRNNAALASYSLWGPSDVADTLNPVSPYDYLKPQVSAPGTNRSVYGLNDTGYQDMSGTSMATPHVAGVIALMWDAAPCLIGDYVNTETLIEQTTTPTTWPGYTLQPYDGPGGVPNNATGWGEINALAAVQAAQNYCGADLPWVWTDPVSGTLPAMGEIGIDVTFFCTQTQTYTGTLVVRHNDPCAEDLELPILLQCVQSSPQPTWDKIAWVNDGLTAIWPLTAPLTVAPGDTIQIVDRVTLSHTDLVTFTLSEQWNNSLALVDWETTAGSLTTATGVLDWQASGVPTDTWHVLTKTFVVSEGDWIYDFVTETLDVQGALAIDQRTVGYLYAGRCVHLEGITIAGAVSGVTGIYTFTTTYTPISATLPVAYLWDNGDTTATSIRNLGEGAYTLTVTATNCIATAVADEHVVVTIPPKRVYLPVVLK